MILKRYQKPNGYLLMPEPHRKGRPRGGTGWHHRYNTARVMRAIVAAGGKRFTEYGMRHSFASNYLIADVTDVKVSRWLGHADTRMLYRHYGPLLIPNLNLL